MPKRKILANDENCPHLLSARLHEQSKMGTTLARKARGPNGTTDEHTNERTGYKLSIVSRNPSWSFHLSSGNQQGKRIHQKKKTVLQNTSTFEQNIHKNQNQPGQNTSKFEQIFTKKQNQPINQPTNQSANLVLNLCPAQTPSTGLRHPSFNHCRI